MPAVRGVAATRGEVRGYVAGEGKAKVYSMPKSHEAATFVVHWRGVS